MKSAAKIFTIIGMIAGCFAIYPIIFGWLCLKKMDEAQSKSDLTVWAILNFLLCSPIGGLFMLLIDEKEFPAGAAAAGNNNNQQQYAQAQQPQQAQYQNGQWYQGADGKWYQYRDGKWYPASGDSNTQN
jgi:hypothetical protein